MLRGAGWTPNASDRLIEGVFYLLFSCFSLVGWRQRVVRACSTPPISPGLSQSPDFVPSPEIVLVPKKRVGLRMTYNFPHHPLTQAMDRMFPSSSVASSFAGTHREAIFVRQMPGHFFPLSPAQTLRPGDVYQKEAADSLQPPAVPQLLPRRIPQQDTRDCTAQQAGREEKE